MYSDYCVCTTCQLCTSCLRCTSVAGARIAILCTTYCSCEFVAGARIPVHASLLLVHVFLFCARHIVHVSLLLVHVLLFCARYIFYARLAVCYHINSLSFRVIWFVLIHIYFYMNASGWHLSVFPWLIIPTRAILIWDSILQGLW